MRVGTDEEKRAKDMWKSDKLTKAGIACLVENNSVEPKPTKRCTGDQRAFICLADNRCTEIGKNMFWPSLMSAGHKRKFNDLLEEG
jgi:hypothetical protein